MEESYSVLIAEDELLVRTGIGASYAWSENSLYVVADVADGASAWAAYQEHTPDIVITDLCMPGMSGTEFIRAIRATGNRCAVIVITCLNDEGTLCDMRELAVCACLIKATMRQKDILQALTTAVNQLRSSPETGKRPEKGHVARVTERLFTEYLLQNGDYAALASAMARVSSPLIQPKTAAVMLADIDCRHQSMLGKMLFGMARDCFIKTRHDLIFGNEQALFLLAPALSAAEIQALTDQAEALSAYVYDTFDCRIRFALTSAAPPLKLLPDWTARVLSQKDAICAAASAVVRVNQAGEADDPDMRRAFDRLYLSVWIHLAAGEENECLRLMTRAEAAGKRSLPPFTEALKRLAGFLFPRANALLAPKREKDLISALCRARDCAEAMRMFERQWTEGLDAKDARDKKSIVTEIAHGILRRPEEKLTLKSVSERVNFNPVYFSAMFKQTMGIGFSEFLINARIRAACVSMTMSDLPVNEVADACGFSDHAYFSRRFKQQLGISPSDWRTNNDG